MLFPQLIADYDKRTAVTGAFSLRERAQSPIAQFGGADENDQGYHRFRL
jgi:hypothetical protein